MQTRLRVASNRTSASAFCIWKWNDYTSNSHSDDIQVESVFMQWQVLVATRFVAYEYYDTNCQLSWVCRHLFMLSVRVCSKFGGLGTRALRLKNSDSRLCVAVARWRTLSITAGRLMGHMTEACQLFLTRYYLHLFSCDCDEPALAFHPHHSWIRWLGDEGFFRA